MRRELIAYEDPKSHVSELFRTLRTNVQFMNSNKKLRTLLVTSTIPNEGKSWIASNLAITFAQANKRVLLIDADMRKCSLHRIFRVASCPGLSNYLARVGENITDVTDKGEYVETKENESVDKAGCIVRRISELGGYENVSDSVKADIFGFDIADVSGSIRLFSDVMKRLGIKLDGDELYEEFQRTYDKSVDRDADKEKTGDKIWNNGRGR